MAFDFFGDRKKAVVAMADIAALPGPPLCDADRGMDKLIENVARESKPLQGGLNETIEPAQAARTHFVSTARRGRMKG